MEFLRNWILYVTGSAVLSAICLNVVPKGRVKKAVQLVCGLITLLCLAYPVTSGKLDELEGFEFAAHEIEYFANDAAETEKTVTRMVIEARYAAYILDKGEKLGVGIAEADVSVRWNDNGYWYPVRADIKTAESGGDTQELGRIISQELGLDLNNIYWS